MKQLEPKEYINDAPSFIWKIYELMVNDKVFEAEDLTYAVFKEIKKSEPRQP